jgi:hypothetical protein
MTLRNAENALPANVRKSIKEEQKPLREEKEKMSKVKT